MFYKRPDNLARKRRIAVSTWKKVESFYEYFQDKMIPAENVCLDQEELIDLVIDDISETDLRNQSRMHSFKIPFDLLKAFSMITLRDTRSDRDKSDNRKPLEQCSPRNQARHFGELRCFNCNGTGQSQKDCPYQRREWGTCYKCGDP